MGLQDQNEQNLKRSVGRPRKNPNSHNVQRRYNLALNNEDFEAVKEISDERGVSFLQTAQNFIRFGIQMYRETKNGKAQIILRKTAQEGQEAEDVRILMI